MKTITLKAGEETEVTWVNQDGVPDQKIINDKREAEFKKNHPYFLITGNENGPYDQGSGWVYFTLKIKALKNVTDIKID